MKLGSAETSTIREPAICEGKFAGIACSPPRRAKRRAKGEPASYITKKSRYVKAFRCWRTAQMSGCLRGSESALSKKGESGPVSGQPVLGRYRTKGFTPVVMEMEKLSFAYRKKTMKISL
jgi:hypothetical protein